MLADELRGWLVRIFFFSSRRRHTRYIGDWSSDVCSSDLDNKPHECSQTWQVVRSEFDLMMLNNAREQGVQAEEGVRVLEVLFDGPRAVGVRLQQEDGTQEEVRAKVVVDASGQSTMLQNRF